MKKVKLLILVSFGLLSCLSVYEPIDKVDLKKEEIKLVYTITVFKDQNLLGRSYKIVNTSHVLSYAIKEKSDFFILEFVLNEPTMSKVNIVRNDGIELFFLIDQRNLKGKKAIGELKISMTELKFKDEHYFYFLVDKFVKRTRERNVFRTKIITDKKYHKLISEGANCVSHSECRNR